MSRPISELRRKMSLKARAASVKESRRLRAEVAAADMALQDLRKAYRFSQAQIAEIMGLDQPSVSRLEKQSDMLLSTLGRYVAAMGGQLEVVAKFDKATVRLSDLQALKSSRKTSEAFRRSRSKAA
jgi:predicted XRE-type DNA-binding protein